MQKVKLLRPLDGSPEGAQIELPELDAKRLQERGVVKFVEAKEAKAPANKAEPAPANKSKRAKKDD